MKLTYFAYHYSYESIMHKTDMNIYIKKSLDSQYSWKKRNIWIDKNL